MAYLLEGSQVDLPLWEVTALNARQRRSYCYALTRRWNALAERGEMSLISPLSPEEELRDLRRLHVSSPDAFLRLDGRTFTRDVLMVGAPGASHVHWSGPQLWKVGTRFGHLPTDLATRDPRLIQRLCDLFDPTKAGKATYRTRTMALPVAYAYLRQHYNTAVAFPPLHARFLADLYLRGQEAATVVDPCAGWGGRLVGTLLIPRPLDVHYVGVDPNRNNARAYEGLLSRVAEVRAGLGGRRDGQVIGAPFEDWLNTSEAEALMGTVDLVMTSPPYGATEIYDVNCPSQSASRYPTYEQWRAGFFRPLIDGAYRLLKPGGVFVLNVADAGGNPLEHDALLLARDAGFAREAYFKLAMNITPGTKAVRPRHWVRVDGVVWKFEPVFVWRKRCKP